MALPKLQNPVFQLTLPSNGQLVNFRQFTVREEKILLMAQASGAQADMISAFKQLVNNCCVESLDIDKMPAFDIEYFFLQLRAKSVSNIVKITFEEGGKTYETEVNLDNIQVHKPTVSNKIMLSPEQGIGVILRYPTFAMLEEMAVAEQSPAASLEILKKIIESVFDADAIHPTADTNPEDLDEFVQKLNKKQVTMIEDFLEDMPYVYVDVEYTTDAGKQTTRIRGIESFFD